jgi:hypothetical protein
LLSFVCPLDSCMVIMVDCSSVKWLLLVLFTFNIDLRNDTLIIYIFIACHWSRRSITFSSKDSQITKIHTNSSPWFRNASRVLQSSLSRYS